MIPQAQIQQVTLSLLEKYTGCTCVPSNTTKQMPAYPYISFSVINTDVKKGTYAAATIIKDGVEIPVLFKELLQKWSFTVQSDDEAEAQEKAMLVHDFFTEARRQELEDNDIIVADVGAITPRDNLLTVEYEYRKGLDVTLRFNNVIEHVTEETIQRINLNNELLGNIELEKE